MTNFNWRDRASCREHDPELWFPVGEDWTSKQNQARAEVALAVCATCPVREACLADALDRGDAWAILGGTLPAQRRGAVRRSA